MKRIILASILAATSAHAQTAFSIDNAAYSNFPALAPLSREQSRPLEGYNTISLQNATVSDFKGFLRRLGDAATKDEPIIVILRGFFANSGTESYLLAADSQASLGLPDTLGSSLPLSTVLAVLDNHDGESMILLSEQSADAPMGMGLTSGVGTLDVPNGITVMRGSPEDLNDLVRKAIDPEGDLTMRRALQNAAIRADGYRPSNFRAFVPAAAAGERVTPAARPQVSTTTEPDTDTVLWTEVSDADTLESYELYLRTFPSGSHAEAAKAAIDKINSEPNREARIGEEGLSLSREARQEIQRDLVMLDYDTRGIDGIFGPGSRNAIKQWQEQNGFDGTSYLTRDQISRIDGQAERRNAELEEEARRKQAQQEAEDRAFWEGSGQGSDAAGLRAYVKRYPDGVFSEVAKERLAEIEQDARTQAQAVDRDAWDRARQANTVEAYRGYVEQMPQGSFVDDANAAIESMSVTAEERAAIERAQQDEAGLGLAGPLAAMVEKRLSDMGLEPGPVDGNFDEQTRRAIRRFQSSRGLPVTGYMGQSTAVRLLADGIFQ